MREAKLPENGSSLSSQAFRCGACKLVGPSRDAISIPDTVLYVLERVAEFMARFGATMFGPPESLLHTPSSQIIRFAFVTQTCDIVRGCDERSFVEVCPLVEVDEDKLHEIERGRRPNYAHIPGVSNQRLVADLDRVMTV